MTAVKLAQYSASWMRARCLCELSLDCNGWQNWQLTPPVIGHIGYTSDPIRLPTLMKIEDYIYKYIYVYIFIYFKKAVSCMLWMSTINLSSISFRILTTGWFLVDWLLSDSHGRKYFQAAHVFMNGYINHRARRISKECRPLWSSWHSSYIEHSGSVGGGCH